MHIQILKLKVTNDYLVRAGDQYLLVDTGYEYEWELFCHRLADVGVRLNDIGWLLLTHHHDDHAGLLTRLVDANPSLKVIISKPGRALLASGKHYHTSQAGYVNRRIGFLLILKGRFDKKWTHTFPPYHSRESDILIDGETPFETLGIPLPGKIIPTPGHSPDHISVVFDDGDCLVGDAAANFLQWAGAKYCVISIDDLDAYYDSWQKLIAVGAKHIYPSHGSPFRIEALQKNLGKHKKEHMILFAEKRI
jgi:glyoxylase-like metal-dependent hydrolase (beta-lactamase superfamily II)